MIDKLIGRKVAVYLIETETPLEGVFQGIQDGFIALSERNTPDAEMTFVDRDSVWCITAPETTAKMLPQ
jgi:hypothetical protein